MNAFAIITRTALFGAVLLASFDSLAFTSIASANGNVTNTWSVSHNYGSQKEADRNALENCRVTARKNGLGHLAKQCVVDDRAKGPGYGALTCGDNGCAWVTGYDDSQTAVDAAYNRCAKNFTNCNSNNIDYWEDFAGFEKTSSKSRPAEAKSCVPNTPVRRCTSHCVNGDCLVTYENGCKVRVQVSPQFNSFTNQFEYPSPGC